MKLVFEEGCYNIEATIDNKNIVATEENKENQASLIDIDKALHTLINKCNDTYVLQEVFIRLMMNLGEAEDLGYCEQCGSYHSKFTLEI
jgi:hypothetical protein